jgi:hypothetical protein
MIELEMFVRTYGGWLGLLIYFLYKEVWGVIKNKVIPNQLKTQEAQRLERVDELSEERAFRRSVETERLKEQQKISDAVQKLASSMMQTNSNIQSILTNQTLILTRQDTTLNVVNDAVSDMRAVTGVSRNKKRMP